MYVRICSQTLVVIQKICEKSWKGTENDTSTRTHGKKKESVVSLNIKLPAIAELLVLFTGI